MNGSKEKRLLELTAFLRNKAEEKAEETAAIFARGYTAGETSAYELCAEWIERILQGGDTNEDC